MVNWISLSQTAGTGNATITVTASSYNELLERSTSLVVSGISRSANVNIIQQFNNDFYISPTNISGVPSSGINYYYITVTSNTSWSIVSGPNWLSFNELSGSGSTTISMLADANSGVARTGDVVFENANGLQRTLYVAQVDADEPVVSINLNPSSISVPSSGGSYSLTVTSNGAWTLSAPAWITLSANSGSGDTVVTVYVSQNINDMQGGYISGSTTNSSSLCSVRQDGYYVCSVITNPQTLNFNNSGGSITMSISTICDWELLSYPAWVTPSTTSGSGSGSVTFVVSENRGDDRSGYVQLEGVFIPIEQDGYYHGNPEDEPFTMVFSESGSFLVNYSFSGGMNDGFIKFNDGEWEYLDSNTPTQYNVNAGDVVSFRTTELFEYTSDTKCIAYGNPHTIANGHLYANFSGSGLTSVRDVYIPNDCNIRYFFANCTGLVVPPSAFPSTQIYTGTTYEGMFKNCTSLQTAPVLPLTTDLHSFQYKSMFEGCTSLVNPPVLPATVLPRGVYEYMFKGCTSLVTAPALPSVDMGQYAYDGMFEGCTSLVNPPVLPCTDLVYSSTETYNGAYTYRNMFKDCTSLVTPPNLPANALSYCCYVGMFSGCTSLSTVPQISSIPNTTSCFTSMFYGCVSLTDASSIDFGSGHTGCRSMFENCTGLTTSPIIGESTNRRGDFMDRMFYNCSSLSRITCLRNLDSYYYPDDWVYGVSPNGTFVKKSGTNWASGDNGIPNGWTVVEV